MAQDRPQAELLWWPRVSERAGFLPPRDSQGVLTGVCWGWKREKSEVRLVPGSAGAGEGVGHVTQPMCQRRVLLFSERKEN